jgi:predicted DNA-binding transcriptional regulator AlpA
MSKRKTDLKTMASAKIQLTPDADTLVPGPKLRRLLGISPVTLWRWRHDKSMQFPAAKSINGRLYFSLPAVQAWLDRQSVAA